jgi:hypothetical protein
MAQYLCAHAATRIFFGNQVEELTEKLKEQIDTTNPKIREQCIDEKILVDLGRDKRAMRSNVSMCANLERDI